MSAYQKHIGYVSDFVAAALLIALSVTMTEAGLYGLRQRKIVITNESPKPVVVWCQSELNQTPAEVYKNETVEPNQQFILKFKRDMFESPEYKCWTHLGLFKGFSRFYDCNRKESLFTCHWKINENIISHYRISTATWSPLTPDQLVASGPTPSI